MAAIVAPGMNGTAPMIKNDVAILQQLGFTQKQIRGAKVLLDDDRIGQITGTSSIGGILVKEGKQQEFMLKLSKSSMKEIGEKNGKFNNKGRSILVPIDKFAKFDNKPATAVVMINEDYVLIAFVMNDDVKTNDVALIKVKGGEVTKTGDEDLWFALKGISNPYRLNFTAGDNVSFNGGIGGVLDKEDKGFIYLLLPFGKKPLCFPIREKPDGDRKSKLGENGEFSVQGTDFKGQYIRSLVRNPMSFSDSTTQVGITRDTSDFIGVLAEQNIMGIENGGILKFTNEQMKSIFGIDSRTKDGKEVYGFEGNEKVFKLSENSGVASYLVVTRRAVVRIDVPVRGYIADVYNVNMTDEKLVNLSTSDKEYSFNPLIVNNANMVGFATQMGSDKWRVMFYFHNTHGRVWLQFDSKPSTIDIGVTTGKVNGELLMYGIAKPKGLEVISAVVLSKPKSGGESGSILDRMEEAALQSNDAKAMLDIARLRMNILDEVAAQNEIYAQTIGNGNLEKMARRFKREKDRNWEQKPY